MSNKITVSNLPAISHNNIPVVTTELLASLYGTQPEHIKNNHNRNKSRFVCGKHYYKLEGTELKEFKDRVSLRYSVKKRTRSLIVWTERGAARHAKMIETDQAWEVFEALEDCYFNKKVDRLVASKFINISLPFPGRWLVQLMPGMEPQILNAGEYNLIDGSVSALLANDIKYFTEELSRLSNSLSKMGKKSSGISERLKILNGEVSRNIFNEPLAKI